MRPRSFPGPGLGRPANLDPKESVTKELVPSISGGSELAWGAGLSPEFQVERGGSQVAGPPGRRQLLSGPLLSGPCSHCPRSRRRGAIITSLLSLCFCLVPKRLCTKCAHVNINRRQVDHYYPARGQGSRAQLIYHQRALGPNGLPSVYEKNQTFGNHHHSGLVWLGLLLLLLCICLSCSN